MLVAPCPTAGQRRGRRRGRVACHWTYPRVAYQHWTQSTLSPQPSTLTPKPSTLNYSTVSNSGTANRVQWRERVDRVQRRDSEEEDAEVGNRAEKAPRVLRKPARCVSELDFIIPFKVNI